MGIKRVLLPMVDDGGMEPVAEAAFLLGRLFQAEVRGLLVTRPHRKIAYSGEFVGADAELRILENARQERDERRQRARDLFERFARRLPAVESEYASKEGDIVDIIAHEARLADLSVLAGNAPDGDADGSDLREAALFQSGRPVLVVPRQGCQEQQFERIIIAWKESIEAARAVAAAHPFLLRAKQVHLITVGESTEAEISLQDVEQYVQVHHAEVESETVRHNAGEDVADILQRKVQASGGALLVMGAYSHWRWREQLFGGVTDSVLRRTQTPVLMAH
jgi:nucleotide-binding universal stress UspA family protein